MSKDESLRARIEAILSQREFHRGEDRERLEQRMGDLASRQEKFRGIADQIFREVIEPRLQTLASYIDDASQVSSERPFQGTVVFNREGRLAVDMKLELGITTDRQCAAFIVESKLRIIPMLLQFAPESRLELPLDRIDTAAVEGFVDDRVVDVLETYLEVEANPHYRKKSEVTDPVCGMVVDRNDAAASIVHEGQTYHFCSETCRRRFAQKPAVFVSP